MPRATAGSGGEVESGIMTQDRLLEPPQLLARLEAKLIRELAAGRAVGLEGLRLPAGAIEREHQLGAQALPQRVLRHERLQLADELGMPPGGEIGFDALLERRQPELLEPRDLGLGERLVGQVGERGAAPERERLT